MLNKKKLSRNVFIGLSDVASFIDDWRFGFESNGCRVMSGSLHLQSKFQTSKLDFNIEKAQNRVGYFKPGKISSVLKPWWNRKVKQHYFKKATRQCDTFFFIWNSFEADFSDYRLLKQLNKKIIIVLVGDDVRWYFAMKQEHLKAGLRPVEFEDYDYSVKGLQEKLSCLRNAEKYADMIVTQPCALQLALRPYHNLFIPIIARKFIHRPDQREKPLIIHAPTSLSKGTKYIDPVIEQLKSEGIEFDYKCLVNVPRHEALKEYANADIIIDQLLIPGGGKLAYEGLAMGKVVVTLMASERYDQKKTSDCPLVDADPESLYSVLKALIPDHTRRIDIASKGREFIKRYHDPVHICGHILETLDTLIEDQQTDFKPVFFRNEFIPESGESIPVYNQWTNYVKECAWYARYVSPGEREGLIF